MTEPLIHLALPRDGELNPSNVPPPIACGAVTAQQWVGVVERVTCLACKRRAILRGGESD